MAWGRLDRASLARLASTAVAVLAATAAGAWWVGRAAGGRLGRGYTFDWYVHVPPPVIPATTAAWAVAGLAALVAVVAAALALTFVHAAWDALVRAGRADGRPGPGAKARSVVALPALAAALVVPALAGGAVAFSGDVPRGEALAGTATGACLVSAVAAVLLASVWAMSRLAAGRTLPRGQGVNVVGHVAVFASRYAKTTVALVLVGTLVLGSGIREITTDVDVADVLPRGDHNSTAAKNLTTKFKSAFTQQVTFQFRTASEAAYAREAAGLPNRRTSADPHNISDELYIRALYEATEFIKNEPDSPFVGSVGLSDFYALINWTIAGGRGAAGCPTRDLCEPFSLPGRDRAGSVQFAAVEEGVWRAIPETALAVMGVDRDQTAVVFSVDPQEPMSSKEIGEIALVLRDRYVARASSDPAYSKIFTGENAPIFTVDLPIANAHSSELAGADLERLMPPIAAFILVSLFIAFRHPGSILVAFTALAVSVTWTFGAMGNMGIPLNTLNLTLVPLIMGVGIDYGIHLVNEYQEQRGRGHKPEQAWGHVGSHGGLALLLGTLTTLGGLAVMVVSPSLLIAQLGILSLIAMASTYLVAITFIPAGITLFAKEAQARQYRPSPLMEGMAAAVAKHRIVVAGLLVFLSVVAYASALGIGKEGFGDPPRNWLADDPLRVEHEASLAGYYGVDEVKANVLVFEGDILDPAAHAYMDEIERRLKDPQNTHIFHDRIRTLPFLVRTYQAVEGGAPGAGRYLLVEELIARGVPGADGQDPYPETREEMAALMDDVFDSPLYQFGNLFIDYPDSTTAIMVVTVRATTFEDASAVWEQVWGAVRGSEDLRPAGMSVAFVGNTATNYLFIEKELPWINYMSVAATTIVIFLVAVTTRDLRAILTVGTLSAMTGLWWIGILPVLGVGLAITLTLPLVFIFAIGSDYGLHLSASVRRSRDLLSTFRTTGKAVLFSFVTTFGAFLVYTQVSNLAVRRTMIATTVATVVIFVASLLVVPLIWGSKRYMPGEKPPAEPAKALTPVAPPRGRVVAIVDEPPR